MIGWERIERDWLFAFLSDTARPWPKHAVLAWLRYAHNARKRGVQIQTPTREGGWVLQGALLSGRDLAEAVGLTYKVTRALMESPAWNDFTDERAEAEPARAQTGRSEGAARAQAGRSEGASGDEKSTPKADRPTTKGRSEGASRAQRGRSEGASRALARAFPLTQTETQTPTQTGEAVSATVTDSPPPAEPAGSPADLWSKAADLAEGGDPPLAEMETPADPEAWRASEEFQPSTNAYVFDDAEPVGASEQPNDFRQIESPATRAPEAPPQDLRPSPTRQGNGEGAPGPATGAQNAPSLFGRTDTAPPPSAPAKALQRPRKAPPAPLPLTHPDNPQGKDGATLPYAFADGLTSEDVSEDGLTLWREWWRRQSAPARTKLDEGRAKYIRKALTTHKLDELLTLIRYAYDAPDLGPYQRAWRGADGKDRPPLDMLLRDENRQRNVDRARDWLDSTTDEATGLRILPPKPTPTVNGRPDKMSMIQNLLLKERQNAQSHCNP